MLSTSSWRLLSLAVAAALASCSAGEASEGGAGGTVGSGGASGAAGTRSPGRGGGAGSGAGGREVEPGIWGAPRQIESNAREAFYPRVSIGSGGEAFAVWLQTGEAPSEYDVWANRYTSTEGWVGGVAVGAADRAESIPDVACGADGTALVVWGGFLDPMTRGVLAARFEPGDGWSTGVAIDDNQAASAIPKVAAGPSGSAMAIWTAGTSTWTNRFDLDAGWGSPTTIDDEANTPRNPQIAVRPDGFAWAGWEQPQSATELSVFANRYDPGAGWAGAVPIDTVTMGIPMNPQLAVAPQGEAVYVWARERGSTSEVWAAHWGDALAPRESVRIDTAQVAAKPQVAVDSDGNAVAVWQQATNGGDRIYASWYTLADGWSRPRPASGFAPAADPQVAVGGDGRAIVVYTNDPENGQPLQVWASRFDPSVGWDEERLIGPTVGAGAASEPHVAMDPTGNAVAVWKQGIDIWAARFEP